MHFSSTASDFFSSSSTSLAHRKFHIDTENIACFTAGSIGSKENHGNNCIHTLPETNISLLKIGLANPRPKRKGSSSRHQFSGFLVVSLTFLSPLGSTRKGRLNRPWFLAISGSLMTAAFLLLQLGEVVQWEIGRDCFTFGDFTLENYHGTPKWRFGRWFSFSIGWLLGSMLIFHSVFFFFVAIFWNVACKKPENSLNVSRPETYQHFLVFKDVFGPEDVWQSCVSM